MDEPVSGPRRSRARHLAWIAGLVVLALVSAGCVEATNELNPSREELKVVPKGSLGKVVADDEGRTVYLFEGDGPGKSYCSGACASVWPPVTTRGMPEVQGGLAAGKVSLLKRGDGLAQVVFDDHPLYYYQGDTSSKDANGEELNQFGAEWYAVTPQGGFAEPGGGEGGGESGGS